MKWEFILRSRDPGKSTNGIPPLFLKECADVLAPAFCRLFRFIVRMSIYPTDWKIGRIIPLHKRSSTKLPKNYRPVQVLDGTSVCFESCIHGQYYAWNSKFVPESQYGFLRQCGTLDYGMVVAFPMIVALEKRHDGILISLDVAGAFDRCWWERIKSRLIARGMQGKALALLKDYLYKRFIRVVCGGESSSAKEFLFWCASGWAIIS